MLLSSLWNKSGKKKIVWQEETCIKDETTCCDKGPMLYMDMDKSLCESVEH